MRRPGSRTITWGIIGLWRGSVYSAMSRSFWTIRLTSERKGQWAPTPVRYSFVSVMLSVLDRDQPAIGNLQLTMECNKAFSLPAVLGAETSATEDEDHRICPCSSESFRRFVACAASN